MIYLFGKHDVLISECDELVKELAYLGEVKSHGATKGIDIAVFTR